MFARPALRLVGQARDPPGAHQCLQTGRPRSTGGCAVEDHTRPTTSDTFSNAVVNE
jgi:hypothetical protein